MSAVEQAKEAHACDHRSSMHGGGLGNAGKQGLGRHWGLEGWGD